MTLNVLYREIIKLLNLSSCMVVRIVNYILLHRSQMNMNLTMTLIYFVTSSMVMFRQMHLIDAKLNSEITQTDMIKGNGYPVETHQVTTFDGYILTLYRIPGHPISTPVLLQHGLVESSSDWLYTGKNKSLAYILVDQGYDVWLGNGRGNRYSLGHKILSTDDPRYWDFSWYEWGIYDIPAVITYITDLTGKKMFYIGHSLGAGIFAVMASEKPEMTRKVKAMFALAPAAFLGNNLKPPISWGYGFFWKILQFVFKLFSINKIFSRPNSAFVSDHVCANYILANILCIPLLRITGPDWNQIDTNLVSIIYSKFPSSTSSKLLIHTIQLYTDDDFCNFDYGRKKNLEIYNSTKPPIFDVKKLQVPTAVFYSDWDWLVNSKDVKRFYNELPNKIGIYEVKHLFNHLDFVFGKGAAEYVYKDIVELMAKYNE